MYSRADRATTAATTGSVVRATLLESCKNKLTALSSNRERPASVFHAATLAVLEESAWNCDPYHSDPLLGRSAATADGAIPRC
jgi:hypothetical protein